MADTTPDSHGANHAAPDAPPTSAPSTFETAKISTAFAGLTDPP